MARKKQPRKKAAKKAVKKVSPKKTTSPKKKALKKTARKPKAKKAAPTMDGAGRMGLIKYRAICTEGDWQAHIFHNSAEAAIEYGVERHGNATEHVIDAVGRQR